MTTSEKAFQAGGKACVEAQRNVSMEYSRIGEKLGLFQVWWVHVKEWQACDESGRVGTRKLKIFFFDPESLELCFFILLVFSPPRNPLGFLNLSIISLFSVSLTFAFLFIILLSCFLAFLAEL